MVCSATAPEPPSSQGCRLSAHQKAYLFQVLDQIAVSVGQGIRCLPATLPSTNVDGLETWGLFRLSV